MKTHEIKRQHGRNRTLILTLSAVTLMFAHVATTVAQQNEGDRNPTEVLRKEHDIIAKIAKAAGGMAEDIRRSGTADVERVAKFHDFFKNFADRCHHAKEEAELFPVLREMNVEPVIIDLLIKQHEEGRILLDGIQEEMSSLREKDAGTNREALARYLLEYARLMERHIATENEYLWPRAAAQLSESQKDRLAKAFHRIETEDLGRGFHEKYHALAMDLLEKGESR